MKKLFVFIMLLFSVFSLKAQNSIDSIKITMYGPTEVMFKTTLSSESVYQRCLYWVNDTYKNPDKVLTGKVDNKSITISGYADNAMRYKSLGIPVNLDITYHLYITINDSLIKYKIVIDDFYDNGKLLPAWKVSSLFNKNGEYKKICGTCKSTLENTLNNLYFSFYEKFKTSEITSTEAITELKKWKDKLDLELITQDEYNKKKSELLKFIK